jgi:bacterioferritin (cytochrome b1)
MGEKTDAKALTEQLVKVLPLLARDALGAAIAAGTLPGPEGIALADHLRGLAGDEMRDLERLAARVASLGSMPKLTVAAVEPADEWRAAVTSLVAAQRETLDALVAAIPADADDAEGEASEHLLEHVVARKRDAMEVLERTLR